MTSKKDVAVEREFNQKKINHIFHYTDNFDVLLKILRNGFSPSYCAEKINDVEYYIPMVSFCNIPLRDVDLYMRYGKYGIGMSLEWALKNSISPVVYIHETTPFKDFYLNINKIHYNKMLNEIFDNEKIENLKNKVDNLDYSQYDLMLNRINDITIPAVQFFKNWKTFYKGQKIITYQEREWRFIPKLENEKRIITKTDNEFIELENKNFRKKPHLPNYAADLINIENIRYILIKNEAQREKVIGVLNRKFGEENVIESILSGKLMIIKEDLIHNDF